MAKKSAPFEFNLSEAVRQEIAANPKAKAREIYEKLLADHPKIKKGSFLQAFYKFKSRRRGNRKAAGANMNSGLPTDAVEAIRLAKRLIDAVGQDAAINVIKALRVEE